MKTSLFLLSLGIAAPSVLGDENTKGLRSVEGLNEKDAGSSWFGGNSFFGKARRSLTYDRDYQKEGSLKCSGGDKIDSMTLYDIGHTEGDLDGFALCCSDGEEEGPAPSNIHPNDDPVEVCKDGNGLKKLSWSKTTSKHNCVLVCVVATCMDGSTVEFGESHDDFDIDSDGSASCDSDEHPSGISYVYNKSGITDIEFQCSPADSSESSDSDDTPAPTPDSESEDTPAPSSDSEDKTPEPVSQSSDSEDKTPEPVSQSSDSDDTPAPTPDSESEDTPAPSSDSEDETPEPVQPTAPVAPPVREPTAPVEPPVAPVAVEVCEDADGIPGIQSSGGDACCRVECGQCGGEGCSQVGLASDCCTTDIIEGGNNCLETNAAPCLIGETPAPTPEELPVAPVAPPVAPVEPPVAPVEPPVAPVAPPVAPVAPPVAPVEPPVAPVEPPVAPVAPPVAPVEPPVAPVAPPVAPVAPPVAPVEPPVAPVEPPVAPVEPPVAPVEPPVAPVEPPVAPVEPPVAPVEPPVAPVEPPVAPEEPPSGGGNVCADAGGIPGVQDSKAEACCVTECGQCGGEGCSTVGEALSLGADECCTSAIVDFGEACSEKGSAPCFIDGDAPAPGPDPTIGLDLDGDGNYDRFEYVGCYSNPPAEILDFTNLAAIDGLTPITCFETCASEGALYFVVSGGNKCACGSVPTFIEAEKTKEPVICTSPCSGDAAFTCGGPAEYELFELFDISPDGVPAPAPTPEEAPVDGGMVCEAAGGIAGMQSDKGDACCTPGCTQCGGSGCSTSSPGLTSSDCCSTEIIETAQSCSETGVAPCSIDAIAGAPSPTPEEPTDPTEPTEPAPEEPSPAPEGALPGSPENPGPDLDGDGNLDRWEYVGCFANPPVDIVNFENVEENDALTPITCFETCAFQGALYFVVSDGNKCVCGTDPAFIEAEKTKEPLEPTSSCSGDPAFTCGGPVEYELYQLFDDVAPDGSPAPAPEEPAQPVVPTEPVEPTDPAPEEPVEPTPEEPAPAPEGSTPGSPEAPGPDLDGDGNLDRWDYVGCLSNPPVDIVNFDDVIANDALTPITCFETCAAEGALYFVVSNGDKCACGTDPAFVDAERTKEGVTCASPCSGDAAFTCGGPAEYELYQLFDDVPADGVPAPAPTPEEAPVAPVADPAPAPEEAPVDGGMVCEAAGGIPGMQSDKAEACCSVGCTQCGGPGCSTSSPGLTSADCCSTEIVEAAQACSVTGASPCAIDGVTVEPTEPTPEEPVEPTPEEPAPAPEGALPGSPENPGPDLDGDGNLDRWEYVGCISNPPADVVNFDFVMDNEALTPITCFETCGLEGAVYFVVSAGSKCVCGTDPDFVEAEKTKEPVTCTSPCTGDEAFTCGGPAEYELYELFDDVSADGPAPAPTPEEAPIGDEGNVCPPDAGGVPSIKSNDGTACCIAGCGQCGGAGCSEAGPASDCCVTDIVMNGKSCLEMMAPCFFDEGDNAPAPSPEEMPIASPISEPSALYPEPSAPYAEPSAGSSSGSSSD